MDDVLKGVAPEGTDAPETNPAGEGVQTPEPTETVKAPEGDEAGQDAPEQSSLPQEPVKQKEAFYAQRKTIDELQTKLKEREEEIALINLARGLPQTEGVFTPQIPGSEQYDLSDPATANLVGQMQKVSQEANQARRAAKEAVASMEDSEAWQKFPALNPNSPDADDVLIRAVSREYLAEQLRSTSAGKRPPRLVEVAETVQKQFEQIRNQGREQGASEVKENLAVKEAANLESKGTRVNLIEQGITPEDIAKSREALRARVRRGDMQALAELNKLEDPFFHETQE